MNIPEEALAELVGQLGGLTCVWRDQASVQLGADGGPQAWLALSYTSDRQLGGYEYRQWPNNNNALALDSALYGYALCILTIEAHSFEWDAQPRSVLERVRWGLRTRTSKAVYRRHKLAFVRTGPITATFSRTAGGRRRLDGFLDWTFAYVSGGEPNDNPGITIGTVNGGGDHPGDVRGRIYLRARARASVLFARHALHQQ